MDLLAAVIGGLIGACFMSGAWQFGLMLTAIFVVYMALWWLAIERDAYVSQYGKHALPLVVWLLNYLPPRVR